MDMVKSYLFGWVNDLLLQVQAAENRVYVAMGVGLAIQGFLIFLLFLCLRKARRLNIELTQTATLEAMKTLERMSNSMTAQHNRVFESLLISHKEMAVTICNGR